MKSDRDPKDEDIRRFEDVVCELMDKGHSILDYRGLIKALPSAPTSICKKYIRRCTKDLCFRHARASSEATPCS